MYLLVNRLKERDETVFSIKDDFLLGRKHQRRVDGLLGGVRIDGRGDCIGNVEFLAHLADAVGGVGQQLLRRALFADVVVDGADELLAGDVVLCVYLHRE